MQVDYEYVGQCLADAGVDSSASGAHGMLSGLICGGETNIRQHLSGEWFSLERQGDPAIDACQTAMDDLAQAIYASIDGEDFGFPLLLPDDDAPLQQRGVAVRDWCDGFLYGVGLVAAASEAGLPGQVKEALNDLAEIGSMDVDDISGDEEEEVALTELTEFLWVAAMLVHEEMALEQQEQSRE
jgi:uncharacterized protein